MDFKRALTHNFITYDAFLTKLDERQNEGEESHMFSRVEPVSVKLNQVKMAEGRI